MDTREAGRRGGKARLTKLTPEQRKEIARRGGLKKAANRKAI
jgi:general stress protein YciG